MASINTKDLAEKNKGRPYRATLAIASVSVTPRRAADIDPTFR